MKKSIWLGISGWILFLCSTIKKTTHHGTAAVEEMSDRDTDF